MKKLLLCIAAFMTLCYVVSFAQGDEESAKRRRESLRRLEASADSGIPDAMFRFARVLEIGDEMLPQDSLRAFKLYRMAADSLFPPALNYLGFCYYNGNSLLAQNRDTAITLIEKAASLGDKSAAANLGWLLSQDSTGVNIDTDKALYWLHKAADSGNPAPLAAIADIYLQRADTVNAEIYLDSAAKLGDVNSSLYLLERREQLYDSMPADTLMVIALDYYHNTRALPLAIGIFYKVIDKPDDCLVKAHAMAIIAQLKSLGLGVEYDYEGAMEMFINAAYGGDPSAQYIVAETLVLTPDAFEEDAVVLKPDAFEGDTITSDEWFGKAAAAGITDAHSALQRLMP